MDIREKEQIEIDFWKNSGEEGPEKVSIPNLINKFKEADIFMEKLVEFAGVFKTSAKILEIGGGQGWASCMVKHYHPNSEVMTSDISEYAVQSVHRWEKILGVSLQGKFVARSYETGLSDKSVDLVFCFASAHHFGRHRATLKELKRILVKGGRIVYLHEPVCRRFLYGMSVRRANKKRSAVPEDVICYKKLRSIAEEVGFTFTLKFAPTVKNRSVSGALYFKLLKAFPLLQRFLPCSADMMFTLED